MVSEFVWYLTSSFAPFPPPPPPPPNIDFVAQKRMRAVAAIEALRANGVRRVNFLQISQINIVFFKKKLYILLTSSLLGSCGLRSEIA